MTKKLMAVLALGLAATAAFGQADAPAARVKKAKAEKSAPILHMTSAPVKTLRDEIKRDKGDMTAKTKAGRGEHAQLLAQEKAELAQVAKSVGTRAEKKAARLTVHKKYAELLKEARAKTAYERKNLREDITAKRDQIKKLRQS